MATISIYPYNSIREAEELIQAQGYVRDHGPRKCWRNDKGQTAKVVRDEKTLKFVVQWG